MFSVHSRFTRVAFVATALLAAFAFGQAVNPGRCPHNSNFKAVPNAPVGVVSPTSVDMNQRDVGNYQAHEQFLGDGYDNPANGVGVHVINPPATSSIASRSVGHVQDRREGTVLAGAGSCGAYIWLPHTVHH